MRLCIIGSYAEANGGVNHVSSQAARVVAYTTNKLLLDPFRIGLR
jgi:hypothetical protein